jgi:4-amino-4-deoxy-L-arabinose transferase-like glycosyltransferase
VKKIISFSVLGAVILTIFYLATHLTALTRLPVFADEAIYIRWAQLIIDDWRRYLFFPMNDGKTPLFIWLTVLTLKTFANPLVAGRMISIAAGLIQVFVTAKIVKQLGGKTFAAVISALMITLLPFWYFYHRLSLMDGLLTLLLSLSWFYLFKTAQEKKTNWRYIILAGSFFGLSLLTKLPALLFIPTLLLAPFLVRPKQISLPAILSWSTATLLIGLGVFFSLKLHPAFGQLFTRGNDFLYPIQEVIARGVWPVALINIRATINALSLYLTWPILLLPFFGLFQDKWRRKHLLLILSAVSFLAPVMLLGKTIYPRYFLPAALPLTVSAALVFGQFFAHTQRLVKKPLQLFVRAGLIVLGLTYVSSAALEFIFISWQNPDYLPLTPIDRVQYTQEWSAGHGVKETTDLLLETAKNHTIAVATEGFYGTLPDAMLMYLHNEDVTNILVEGIGQPVVAIPENFAIKAQQYEYVWLVVNDYREDMGLNKIYPANKNRLISWYCRVPGAPCLQVWDITDLVHKKN